MEDKLTAMHADLGELREDVHGLAESDRTIHGRIDTLDRAIFGDPTPGWNRPGLLRIVEQQQPIVEQVARLIKVVRWTGATFVGAAIVGIINLATDAVPF